MTGVGQIGRFGSNFRSQGQFLGFGQFWVPGLWRSAESAESENSKGQSRMVRHVVVGFLSLRLLDTSYGHQPMLCTFRRNQTELFHMLEHTNEVE